MDGLLIVGGVIAALSLMAGAVCVLVACYLPAPLEQGNRPSPPDVLAQRADARAEAWRQYHARQKGQDR